MLPTDVAAESGGSCKLTDPIEPRSYHQPKKRQRQSRQRNGYRPRHEMQRSYQRRGDLATSRLPQRGQ